MNFIKRALLFAFSGLLLLTGAHIAFAATDNAAFVTQTVPTSVTSGQTFSASVTMKNTGTASWTAAAGYKLGSQSPQNNTRWGINRISLGASDKILPNKSKQFTYTFTAPSTPGTYIFQWKMVHEKVRWFGAVSPAVSIVVKAPTLVDNASFATQTVPVSVEAGKTFQARVTMKNTGSTSWTATNGYKLGSQSPQDNTRWGTNRVSLGVGETILPSQSKEFVYDFVAPSTPGTYAFQWRMVKGASTWFGTSSTIVNVVVTPKPSTLPPGVSLGTVRVIYLVPSDHVFRSDFSKGVDRAIKNVRTWYQSRMGGYTFKINLPAVEVAYSDKTAAWFSTGPNDTRLNIYYNAGDEVTRLLGADYGSPDFAWVIYVDTEEGGGLGATGLTVLTQADMLGLIGRSLENANVDRWIGGLGHELGHGFGLNHPEDTSPDYGSAVMGLGYLTYPNAILTSADKDALLVHPLFTYQAAVEPPGPTISGIEVYTHSGGAFTHSQVEPGGTWLETTDGPGTFTFNELSRDSTYIYIFDSSRSMKIRLPIFGGMSAWSADGGATWNDLYPVNRTVQQSPDVYTHSTGAFTHSQVEPGGTWLETSTETTNEFTFKEMKRDTTYVYILDTSRSMHVRISIAGGMSAWSTDGVTWSDLYLVTRKI